MRFQVLIGFVFISIMATPVCSARLSALLARKCVSIQQDIAQRIRTELAIDRIYVFDLQEYFTNGTQKVTKSGLRYVEKENKIAALSAAAQAVLHNANEYNQFSPTILESDSVGVYLN